MEHPRLRDRGRLHADEPYPLNAFTDDLVYAIGGYIVYLLHTGRTDIGGDDWGDAFANAIGGEHLKKSAWHCRRHQGQDGMVDENSEKSSSARD